MNDTLDGIEGLNNTTNFSNEFFYHAQTTYMRFSDISSVGDAITFYEACFAYYPFIFVPMAILSGTVGYYLAKHIVIRRWTNKK